MQTSKYHLNTVYIPPQQRMQQSPYEQMKAQLSRQNYFNPLYVDQNNHNTNNIKNINNKQSQIMDDAISELKKLMNDGNSVVDRQKLSHIHSIKLQPIVNENFISSFDQNEYKLTPEDKVKIVKQKVFRVQNYYNYLYQLKCKQEYNKKQTQIMNYIKQSQTNTAIQPLPSSNNHIKLNRQRSFHQKSSIIRRESGEYNHNKKKTNEQRQEEKDNNEVKVLDPTYTKYEEKRKRQNQSYFLKEKDRKRVELSVVGSGGGRDSNMMLSQYGDMW